MTFPYKVKLLRPVLKMLYKARSKKICKILFTFLKEKESIIDIGCGTGVIALMLEQRGHKILPLDIKDISIEEKIKPVIYNGEKISAGDNQFNTALLITVLHHDWDPEKLIREASRVAKKIIIVEDVFSWKIKKYIDFALDGMINFEIFNQPHTNKKDAEWKKIFKELKLELTDFNYQRSHFGFCHAFYLLEKIR